MYYKLIAVLVFSLFSSNGFSQSRMAKMKATPATEMGKKMTSMLKEKLSLSDDQVVKVSPIMLEDATKKKEILENGSIFTMRGKMKSLDKETTSKLKEVFTTEQMKRYEDSVSDEMKDEFRTWINQRKIN